MRNLQQAAMTACNLFTCTNGGPHGCRHCRADLSYLLSVIGVDHANILEGLPEPTDALLLTREEWEALARPARPDPEDMSAEECEAELEEHDDALFVKRTIEHTVATLCVGDKTIGEWDYLCGDVFTLRAAVRALREHQASQSRT